MTPKQTNLPVKRVLVRQSETSLTQHDVLERSVPSSDDDYFKHKLTPMLLLKSKSRSPKVNKGAIYIIKKPQVINFVKEPAPKIQTHGRPLGRKEVA